MHELQDGPAPEARGLLRILLVWHGEVPAETAGGMLQGLDAREIPTCSILLSGTLPFVTVVSHGLIERSDAHRTPGTPEKPQFPHGKKPGSRMGTGFQGGSRYQ